jgi:hypothetical protein
MPSTLIVDRDAAAMIGKVVISVYTSVKETLMLRSKALYRSRRSIATESLEARVVMTGNVVASLSGGELQLREFRDRA